MICVMIDLHSLKLNIAPEKMIAKGDHHFLLGGKRPLLRHHRIHCFQGLFVLPLWHDLDDNVTQMSMVAIFLTPLRCVYIEFPC